MVVPGMFGEMRRNVGAEDGEEEDGPGGVPAEAGRHHVVPSTRRFQVRGTKFTVDAFQYGEIQGIAAYFLTHFHSDHYGGLTKKSTLPIYCNRITGNLVKSKLRVAEQYVHVLPMNTKVTVEGIKVILLEANHCPGAAMLLFFLPDGQTVLHTGDFRADPSMETYPELLGCRVQTLYLDTTYCSPEYTFPRQQEAIDFAANTAFELVTLNPRTLVVCGSYSVGKEKVFLALAGVLGSKVCLSRDKYNTMCCLESEQVRQRITTDWKAAQVHVLPMMQLSFKKLRDYLARFSGRYDQLVAFKPTGWTFSQRVESVGDIQPQISGNVSIYGIPYSEHSSFLEMKRFVQWLRPLKIIPTVNNGSQDSRKAMEQCFSEWLTETENKLQRVYT
ncbi:DNA cross-link repair 1A protein isoform 2-T2 [Spinachia spinachia]